MTAMMCTLLYHFMQLQVMLIVQSISPMPSSHLTILQNFIHALIMSLLLSKKQPTEAVQLVDWCMSPRQLCRCQQVEYQQNLGHLLPLTLLWICRFLQGPGTDDLEIQKMRDAASDGEFLLACHIWNTNSMTCVAIAALLISSAT